MINLKELFPVSNLSVTKNVLICDVCEKLYRNGSQDYCQICYKLYLPESEDPLETQKNISIMDSNNNCHCNHQKLISPSLNEEEHLMVRFLNLFLLLLLLLHHSTH